MDTIDRQLVLATQGGLPLVARPYARLAEQLGLSEADVMLRLQGLLDRGLIRRIGVVPNHYAIGWTANGMTVWNVPDDKVDELGGARWCLAICDALLPSTARFASLALQFVRHGAREFARGVLCQG